MPCRTILAATIAKDYIAEVQQKVARELQAPRLVGLLANDDDGAVMYAQWTQRTCQECGLEFELRKVSKESLEDAIGLANSQEGVNGIIVYFPVFGNDQDKYLQQLVDPSKDVEGLSHIYLQNLYHNVRFLDPDHTKKSILPCTPLAVIKILEYVQVYNTFLEYTNRLYGKVISVINRSEIAGRPLAALLANDGAIVYSIDVNGVQKFTRGSGNRLRRHQVESTGLNMDDVLPISDVVISGVPATFKVDPSLVKFGSVVINFSSQHNFDAAIKERASIYVPATGKVTIAILLRNLLRLVQNKKP